MSVQRINPPELARPAGFSHATVGTGTVVFLLKLTSYWQIVAQGAILILVVIAGSIVEARSERSGADQ